MDVWIERLKRSGAYAVATGGFVGYFPIAPGTMGSLVGLGIVWLFRDFSFVPLLLLSAVFLGAGAWAAGEMNICQGEADSGIIVIDEIVGMMIAMIGIPVTGYYLFWGFVLFRFFDIVKIPPGNYFDEHVKTGWGVVLDDVSAGIYANVILQLMQRAQV